jgi:hypothetical protein
MPLWKPLLKQLVKDIRGPSRNAELLSYAGKCIREGFLPRAASALRRGAPGLIDAQLRTIFDSDKLNKLPATNKTRIEMVERLDALIALPWVGIITTNYDTLIDEYVNDRGRKGRWESIGSVPSDICRALKSNKKRFLIHLHGSVAQGRMILSEEDYDETYLDSSSIQSILRAILLRYTVVFIGTQVEDRFVEYKRHLQLLFRDRGTTGGGPPLSPEYVLLPRTERQRAKYLEETGGFGVLYYDNATKKHEGLIPLLREIRSRLESGVAGLDEINERLEAIVKKRSPARAEEILRDFWASPPKNHAKFRNLNERELTYRLYYLVVRKKLVYNEGPETFQPAG